eukprot:15324809-Ditylum_brightwellii.AAC.1
MYSRLHPQLTFSKYKIFEGRSDSSEGRSCSSEGRMLVVQHYKRASAAYPFFSTSELAAKLLFQAL